MLQGRGKAVRLGKQHNAPTHLPSYCIFRLAELSYAQFYMWARPAREAPPESSSGDNSDNDNDRLEALLNPWKVPSAEGNEDVIKAINFFNTIPCPPDPLFPDGMVNSAGVWVRPAGWVPPESSSADSSAVKPGDGSEENIPLPPTTQSHGNLSAEGRTGALSESSRTVNNAEKEALVEPLVGLVHRRLKKVLFLCLWSDKSWPPGEEELNELIMGEVHMLKYGIKTGTFKELTVAQPLCQGIQ